MAVTKPTVLVFALVAKHHTDASASTDGNTAEVGGHWQIEPLLLSFYDSLEIEICVAFSVKIYIEGV
ncbi:UNVERIFIED_ORG: hypothetical protein J2Y94_002596 [Pseudomonas poae]